MVIQAHYRFSKHGASGVMPDSLRQDDQVILNKIRSQAPHIYKKNKIKDIKGRLVPEKFSQLEQ